MCHAHVCTHKAYVFYSGCSTLIYLYYFTHTHMNIYIFHFTSGIYTVTSRFRLRIYFRFIYIRNVVPPPRPFSFIRIHIVSKWFFPFWYVSIYEYLCVCVCCWRRIVQMKCARLLHYYIHTYIHIFDVYNTNACNGIFFSILFAHASVFLCTYDDSKMCKKHGKGNVCE